MILMNDCARSRREAVGVGIAGGGGGGTAAAHGLGRAQGRDAAGAGAGAPLSRQRVPGRVVGVGRVPPRRARRLSAAHQRAAGGHGSQRVPRPQLRQLHAVRLQRGAQGTIPILYGNFFKL